MLVDNLPVFKQNLNKLIDGDKSIMYEAAYEASYNAYYEATKVDIDISGQGNNDLKALMQEQKDSCEQKMENDAIKFAENFATNFCDYLKRRGFMDAIADEVNAHIKSAQIDIQIPALLPSIQSPMGPCTGSLSISVATGAQITIS